MSAVPALSRSASGKAGKVRRPPEACAVTTGCCFAPALLLGKRRTRGLQASLGGEEGLEEVSFSWRAAVRGVGRAGARLGLLVAVTGINWATVASGGKGCSFGAFVNLCIENVFDIGGLLEANLFK